jgi:hypothetical protein
MKSIKIIIVAGCLLLGNSPSQAFSVRTHKSNRIFQQTYPTAIGADYRYGPSIILDGNGGVDLWSTKTGNGAGIWDYIEYRKSLNGGKTWSNISVALSPTTNGQDRKSCADPGVVYFGGYYYLGYTSTINDDGSKNNIFVARSSSAGGPWSKWNGSGWGGNPQPFITYNDGGTYYGVGEPSFVSKGGLLYIYYTYKGPSGEQHRMATASTASTNWPASLTYKGIVTRYINAVAITNHASDTDSLDVKYLDDESVFIGVQSCQRFGASSYLKILTSTDGINFYESCDLRDKISAYSHNSGISGRADGHMKLSDNNFVAYANGMTWGYWNIDMNPISFRNLFGIKKWGTGSGKIEVHNADGAANFSKYYASTATSAGQIAAADNLKSIYSMSDWDDDKKSDLFNIVTTGTSSGKVEVHVLTAASGYQTYVIHAASGLNAVVSPANWCVFADDWDGDGRGDLVSVQSVGTATGKIEAYIYGGTSNYVTPLLNAATSLACVTDPANWVFRLADWNHDSIPDLFCIHRTNTASAKVEIVVLSGADRFISHLDAQITALPAGTNWEFNVVDWNGDNNMDIVALYKAGSSSSEVHILKGTGVSTFGSNYTTYLWNTGTILPLCGNEMTLNLW